MVAIGLLLVGQQPDILSGVEKPREQPSSGGMYVEAVVGTPGRLNPLLDWYNNADRDIDRLIYSSLVKFNDRSVPVGDLADSWGISQDGKIYNFLIRDAVWHDGQPVTADDIIFTIDLLRNDAIPIPEDLRNFWNKVEVEIIDDNVIQFRLPEPFSPFLDYLTFGILPKHIWKDIPPEEIANSTLNLNPIGSGPYRFDRYITNQGQVEGVELDSNLNYYITPPFIEKIQFRYFQDAQTALKEYQAGKKDQNQKQDRVMGIDQIPLDLLDESLNEDGLNFYTGLMPRLDLILFNLDDPKIPAIQDPSVREALYKGLNRQGLIDRLLKGQAVLANGPIFPASWAYYENLDQVPYDQEEAISLLIEAGYTLPAEGGNIRSKDGNRLSFELIYPDINPHPDLASAIKDDWAKIGVEVILKSVPLAQMVDNYLGLRQFQMALVEFNGMRYPDPDPYPFWHQSQADRGQNYSGWNDRQASELLEQARTESNPELRAQLYDNFQLRFMKELPSLPLFFPVYNYGVDSEVKGIRAGPIYETADRFRTLANWFLKTQLGIGETPTSSP